jgi:uncharacterized Fe-S cluster-containing radical SAM superfamily enzyme
MGKMYRGSLFKCLVKVKQKYRLAMMRVFIIHVWVHRILLKPISKIVDHAQEQGTGRRKSAAYDWSM